MSNPSPNKVVGGFNRREPQAIVWIYNAYYPAVFNLVLKFAGSRCVDAEDLVAEVFLKLLKAHGRFDRLSKIRSFLYHATKNLCLDYLKRKEIIRDRMGEWKFLERAEPDNTEEFEFREDIISQVYSAIERLPVKQRQLFRLVYVDGLSNKQVAVILQVSSKTIANEKIIALNKLKAILKKGGLLIIIIIFL